MQHFKIAFLFLDEIHHVSHFISVAKALSKKHHVKILTHKNPDRYLYNIADTIQANNVTIEELPTKKYRAFTDKFKNRKRPRKGFWIKKNLEYLLDFDAVVFTDYYHKYLKKACKNRIFPKLIKFNHGIPGRAYAFREDQKDFDLQILVGDFQQQLLSKKAVMAKNIAIGGYPKLDVVEQIELKSYFQNDKPVIFYNPHFDPDFSSWEAFGIDILRFFANQDQYNLIFAPHINLFSTEKENRELSKLPKEILNAENIYIDFGSKDSVDMQFTRIADLYLGDVSSQVYEFIIIQPRPCLFLNPNKVKYKKDPHFRFWKCGMVIKKTKNLNKKLEKAFKKFQKYETIQKEINAENIYLDKQKKASINISEIISNYLQNHL
ncbi:hypothetical protein [Zunongwangia sp.]|uniref:hypothetical protein n=1 Tax=Zunongwangia sp. TaxID=1965325 RepID=UPI003AA86A81